MVVGELKTPGLHLGPSLTASWLEDQLGQGLADVYLKNCLNPFFQCFSYMRESGTGLGILTTYNTTRFFQMKISEHESILYMSPCVRINQLLTTNSPHYLQAYLYVYQTSATQELSRRDMQMQLLESKGEMTVKKGEKGE